jgi:hypothetical protein
MIFDVFFNSALNEITNSRLFQIFILHLPNQNRGALFVKQTQKQAENIPI